MSRERRSNASSFDLGRLANGLLVFLALIVPLVLVKGSYNYVDLPRGIVVQVGAVLILLVWLMKAILQGRLKVVRTPFDLPFLGLVLWAGLSLLWAPNIYEGLEIWTQWGASLVFFFLTVNLVRSERDTLRLLGAVLLAGTLVAVLGIFQYLLEVDWVHQSVPPAATFANRNMAAQFMVVTIPLAAAFLLLSRKRIHAVSMVMALGVLCLFLFYTSTRSAWLAVTIESLFLAILLARDHFKWKLDPPMGKYKKRALVVCAVVGFILINLTPSGFQWQVGTAYNRIQEVWPGLEFQPLQGPGEAAEASVKDPNQPQPVEAPVPGGGSLSVRIRIWKNTLSVGEEHLLGGVGIGNFKIFYPRYARSAVVDSVFDEEGQWQRTHNDYVQIFAELGLVGLFFGGWLLFALTKTCLALSREETKEEVRYLLMGVIVALSGLLVNAFFSFPFQMVTPTFIFAVYLGVLAGHDSRRSLGDESLVPPRKAPILLPSWFATVGTCVTLLFLLMLLRFEYNRLRADWYFRKVDAASQRQDWAEVISQAKEGYPYYPNRKEFLFRMGKAYFETGNLDAGIEATEEFMEAYPYYANGHHNLGMAYALKGDEDSAFRHFNQAFEILPSYAKSHFAVARLHELRNNLDEALEHYRSAVRGDPDNTQFLAGLGQVALKEGLNEEAMDAFDRAVKNDPDNSGYLVQLGTVAAYLRKFAEARAAFGRSRLRPITTWARSCWSLLKNEKKGFCTLKRLST